MIAGAVASAPLPHTAPAIEVPRGACDCHVHVHGPYDRYPLPPVRRYASPQAPLDRLIQRQNALGLDRVIMVQWSAYGTDNTCVAEALRRMWPCARGVAAITADISAVALDELAKTGFRGARVLLMATDAGRQLRAVADRIRDHGWHLEVAGPMSALMQYQSEIADLPVPVVIDHFGDLRLSAGLRPPGLDALVELVRSRRAYVKLSRAYMCSEQAPDFPDLTPIAKALVAAAPDRILWGTNWPHHDVAARTHAANCEVPFRDIDDGHMFNLLADWVPDAAIRKRILVDNPAQLYGFDPVTG